MKVELKQLQTPVKNLWCPGCGDFGILTAIKRAVVELGIDIENVVFVMGIGCHGKMANYINANTFKVIHGRVLPVALGIKMANHKLTVIGHSGDGDAYGIGMGHFPHAIRRNLDMTLIVHDNMVYGLTTGQVAPTSQKGYVSKTTPYGNIENPINPIALAIASGATFVARVFPSHLTHTINVFKQAIQHRGFALVDVLQVCHTFNKVNDYNYYKKRTYILEETDYQPNDRVEAFRKALEWGDEGIPGNGIPVGIFYKEDQPTFEEQIPALRNGPLAQQPLENINIDMLAENFS